LPGPCPPPLPGPHGVINVEFTSVTDGKFEDVSKHGDLSALSLAKAHLILFIATNVNATISKATKIMMSFFICINCFIAADCIKRYFLVLLEEGYESMFHKSYI